MHIHIHINLLYLSIPIHVYTQAHYQGLLVMRYEGQMGSLLKGALSYTLLLYVSYPYALYACFSLTTHAYAYMMLLHCFDLYSRIYTSIYKNMADFGFWPYWFSLLISCVCMGKFQNHIWFAVTQIHPCMHVHVGSDQPTCALSPRHSSNMYMRFGLDLCMIPTLVQAWYVFHVSISFAIPIHNIYMPVVLLSMHHLFFYAHGQIDSCDLIPFGLLWWHVYL